jgi:rhodanese-related sulfurtransferase
MTARNLKEIDARTLKTWIEKGKAVVIDVREESEYAQEHILGARLVPLSGFDPGDFASERLLKTSFSEVYHLTGGIASWKQSGLPVHGARKAPIPIMRQVHILAGTLLWTGLVLAYLSSPWFLALSAMVGFGLLLSGTTGICPASTILKLMPWNRHALDTVIEQAETMGRVERASA